VQYDPALYGCQFLLGGITINGSTDINGCDWILTKESGWFGSPAIKIARVDKPAARGVFRGNEFRGGRVMTLEGVLAAPTVPALRTASRALFGLFPDPHVQYPLTVIEETGLGLSTNVVLDGEILTTPLAATSVTFSIQLVAPDPRKVATVSTTVSVLLAAGGSGGVAYPVTYPVPYGMPGTSGAVTLTNAGTADADPYFVFTGPLTNPSVTRADTGDTVTYNGTLLATDTLTVDSGSGAVLLDGVNRRSLLTALNWFSVPGGRSITCLFRTTSTSDTGILAVTVADTSY
jgi:hypothetical protein